MVRIRLRRMGAKKKPTYRIVVTDQRTPRDGRFIEIIGFYDPRTEPETVEVKTDRAGYWLGVGAQPSESVTQLLTKAKVMDSSGHFIPSPETVDTMQAADVSA